MYVFEALMNIIAKWFTLMYKASPPLSRSITVIASSQPCAVRFQEMEYNIPAAHFMTVLTETLACIEQQQFKVHFPIECRFVRSDDIWLSPAHQRESSYIAVHMYKGMSYQDYFRAVEEIFKRYSGRPHWGKMHTQTTESLAALYPHWEDFRRVRTALDPQGVFLNEYLRALFAVDSPVRADIPTGQV